MSLGNVEYSSSNYYHRAFSEKFTSDETTSDFFLDFEFTSDQVGRQIWVEAEDYQDYSTSRNIIQT